MYLDARLYSDKDKKDKCNPSKEIYEKDEEVMRHREKCNERKCSDDCRPFMPCPGTDPSVRNSPECKPTDKEACNKVKI